MDKKTEALKLALDCVSTLANARDWVGCNPNERWDEDEMYAELCNATICLKKSLSIIQEALAEQPAHVAAVNTSSERVANQAKNVHEQPAQQEPVATLDDIQQEIYENTREFVSLNVMEWMLKRYYTPPASKPWVGLTDEEVDECYYWKGRQWTTDELVRHVEAKLREKNNG